MRKKNVFVIGMDRLNKERLEMLPQAKECRFHPLLTYEETHGARRYEVNPVMEKSLKILDEFDGTIDAITGFWDFPVSILQTILAERYHTRGTSTESVYHCENKNISRCRQEEVIPECVPEFKGFNPFDDQLLEKINLDFPFWIKPVKSFAGHLGFKIESEQDFKEAISKMRKRVESMTGPFFELLEYASGNFKPDKKILCIAEGMISGHQCTLEGAVYEHDVHIHGVVDSLRYKDISSFSCYHYPSKLPATIKERMTGYARKIMKHIGFNNSAFNIEFYWDKDTDAIKLLEINPRISQSHAELFRKVDGVYNHKIILDAALGYPPEIPSNEGKWEKAGKFFVRHFRNGIVKKVPGKKNIEKIKEKYPDVVLDLVAEEGQELEDLPYQDSYSYKLGFVYLGGADDEEMQRKFEDVKKILDYRIEDF